MNDLISIIIPVFNNDKHLERCLESVISQTYENLEIIIINDGSTDNTGKLLDEIVLKDHRIKLIHQQNQGVSTTRNNALKIATGNLIGFIDADDEIASDMYEFLHHNLQKYNADISHCGFELKKMDKIVKFHGTGITLLQDNFEAIKELLSGKRVEPSSCTKLFRKSVIGSTKFASDIKINEDLLFNIEVFLNAKKIIFEDVVKYRYNFNPASASRSSQALDRLKDGYEVANRIKKLLIQKEVKDSLNQFYVGKLLANLKTFKDENKFTTDFAKIHSAELRKITTKNMGLRIRTLKSLLLNFPFLYHPFVFFYAIFFSKNQKWK